MTQQFETVAIRKELFNRCPDEAPELLDVVSELAAMVDEVTTRRQTLDWDLETLIGFSGVVDRLTRGLWMLGPKRIEQSRAEYIAQSGIMLSAKLLVQLPPEGSA